MTQVLVVCKTRMKTELCLGGLVRGSYEKIRLLTQEGRNQPQDTDFHVGDIWECQLIPQAHMRKPHTEDMLVTPQRMLRRVSNMREFLLQRLDLEPSHMSTLFDGLLNYTKNGSAYISERMGVPGYAHAFWRPVFGLSIRREPRKIYYEYEDSDSLKKFRLRYVGLAAPVSRIAPGSLLHLSLARWWRQPGTNEERCYLQLSGWFL